MIVHCMEICDCELNSRGGKRTHLGCNVLIPSSGSWVAESMYKYEYFRGILYKSPLLRRFLSTRKCLEDHQRA